MTQQMIGAHRRRNEAEQSRAAKRLIVWNRLPRRKLQNVIRMFNDQKYYDAVKAATCKQVMQDIYGA